MPGRIFAALLALGEGLFVGTALVAFLTVLDLIPRVAHTTRSRRKIRLYEHCVLAGALLGSLTDILPPVRTAALFVAFVGFMLGTFTGLFTAALAEVLNVIPVFGRRFDMERSITLLILALAVGKTLGSLIYWLLPQLRL